VQFTSGALDGSYNTNNFADIPASQLIAPGGGIFTNTYTDVGGATSPYATAMSGSAKFFRVKL